MFHEVSILGDDVDLLLHLPHLLLQSDNLLLNRMQLLLLGSRLSLELSVLLEFLCDLVVAGFQLTVDLLQTIDLLLLIIRLLPIQVHLILYQTQLSVPIIHRPP